MSPGWRTCLKTHFQPNWTVLWIFTFWICREMGWYVCLHMILQNLLMDNSWCESFDTVSYWIFLMRSCDVTERLRCSQRFIGVALVKNINLCFMDSYLLWRPTETKLEVMLIGLYKKCVYKLAKVARGTVAMNTVWRSAGISLNRTFVIFLLWPSDLQIISYLVWLLVLIGGWWHLIFQVVSCKLNSQW